MTVFEALAEAWNAVEADAAPMPGYYHRRMAIASTWPVHAGIHAPVRHRVLILDLDGRDLSGISLRDETRGYRVETRSTDPSHRDQTTICIEEVDPAFRKIFADFCTDILEHWITQTTPASALDILEQRLECWKKFFQRGPQIGLSREEHAGLYGELFFIECGIKKGMPADAMLKAWQGPFSTNQDFLFGPQAVEVKTVTANDSNRVRIANARQLDSVGLDRLFLYRSAFDFRDGSGRLLSHLITALRTAMIERCPHSLAAFGDRLLAAGYMEGKPNDFDGWGFTLRNSDAYEVREGFPRLLESAVMPGISEISYVLNLGAAAGFRMEESSFWPQITVTHV